MAPQDLVQPKNLVFSLDFLLAGKFINQKFFKNLQESNNLDFISFLKFRGGYGQIGNSEPAGDFAYKGTTSINSSAVIFGPDGTQTQISGSTADFVPNLLKMGNYRYDQSCFRCWIV